MDEALRDAQDRIRQQQRGRAARHPEQQADHHRCLYAAHAQRQDGGQRGGRHQEAAAELHRPEPYTHARHDFFGVRIIDAREEPVGDPADHQVERDIDDPGSDQRERNARGRWRRDRGAFGAMQTQRPRQNRERAGRHQIDGSGADQISHGVFLDLGRLREDECFRPGAKHGNHQQQGRDHAELGQHTARSKQRDGHKRCREQNAGEPPQARRAGAEGADGERQSGEQAIERDAKP